MSHAVLPKYFVSRTESQAPVSETLPPSHVLDSFFLGNRHLAPQEWIVATDLIGNLVAWPDGERSALPATIQAEMTFFEMTDNAPKRLVQAAEVYLFYLQMLEQPAPTPGINDPIYLYGTLFGPLPNAATRCAAGIQGQLTITRADLLEALVQNARYAYRYASAPDEPPHAPRCFHLLLPADRAEELAQGRGLVLAYPLLPPALILNAVNNEQFVRQLAFDVLSALREDLQAEDISLPLTQMTLPVPSRQQLEQDLQAEGYEIKGNTARKQFQSAENKQGWLRALFGSLTAESLDLPPEGTIEDFINLAAQTLSQLPDWPSPRALALRQRVSAAPPEAYQRARSAPGISWPAPTSMPPRVAQRSADSTAWIEDFIASHQTPGQPAPRLTTTSLTTPLTVPPTKSTSSEQPSWQQDFALPTQSPETKAKPAKQQKAQPDWIKDFE